MAYLGLLVASWALTLYPLAHGLFHRADHVHAADGTTERLDPSSGWHVHADGSSHAEPDVSLEAALSGRSDRSGARAQRPSEPAGGLHGRGALGHFGVSLLGAAALLVPPSPVPRPAALVVAPTSFLVRRIPLTPLQPRAPPVAVSAARPTGSNS